MGNNLTFAVTVINKGEKLLLFFVVLESVEDSFFPIQEEDELLPCFQMEYGLHLLEQ